MNFTQEQIKQILQEVVEEQDGFNKLMKMTLEVFMLSERKPYQHFAIRAFAIGAYFEKVNDKLVLKIALNKKRRAWFSGLWNYSKVFEFRFVFSNA